MSITTSTRLTGIIGWPIAHSLSPFLHSYWLKVLSLDGIYIPFAVETEKLRRALESLSLLGFRGINVTLPHKEKVALLVDEMDSIARRIGSVNTLVWEKGRVLGFNTDVYGFTASLENTFPLWRTCFRTAMVLGAGGASRAVIMALCEAGVERLYLVNRTQKRAVDLASWLHHYPIHVYDWEQRNTILSEVDVLVNTTTLGMKDQEESAIDVWLLAEHVWVIDIVYHPLETPLLKRARIRGLHTIDGLDMLMYQGAMGFEYWFGERPQVTCELRAYMENFLVEGRLEEGRLEEGRLEEGK